MRAQLNAIKVVPLVPKNVETGVLIAAVPRDVENHARKIYWIFRAKLSIPSGKKVLDFKPSSLLSPLFIAVFSSQSTFISCLSVCKRNVYIFSLVVTAMSFSESRNR